MPAMEPELLLIKHALVAAISVSATLEAWAVMQPRRSNLF